MAQERTGYQPSLAQLKVTFFVCEELRTTELLLEIVAAYEREDVSPDHPSRETFKEWKEKFKTRFQRGVRALHIPDGFEELSEPEIAAYINTVLAREDYQRRLRANTIVDGWGGVELDPEEDDYLE